MYYLREKFYHIFLPFLFIQVGFLIFYTLFHWLVLIKLQLFTVPMPFAEFMLPLFLPFIPVRLWLTPRLKYLPAETNVHDEKVGPPVTMVSILAIGIPTMMAQVYLKDSLPGESGEYADSLLFKTIAALLAGAAAVWVLLVFAPYKKRIRNVLGEQLGSPED